MKNLIIKSPVFILSVDESQEIEIFEATVRNIQVLLKRKELTMKDESKFTDGEHTYSVRDSLGVSIKYRQDGMIKNDPEGMDIQYKLALELLQ